jgi:hypothetical protein
MLLNDKRLSQFAGEKGEDLAKIRLDMIELMKQCKMFGEDYEGITEQYFKGGTTAENLAKFMNALYKGDILLRMTPMDINEITEYNRSMEEVYRSL